MQDGRSHTLARFIALTTMSNTSTATARSARFGCRTNPRSKIANNMHAAASNSVSRLNGWPSPIQETPSLGNSGRATTIAVNAASNHGRTALDERRWRDWSTARAAFFRERAGVWHSCRQERHAYSRVTRRIVRRAVASRIAITANKQPMMASTMIAPARSTWCSNSAPSPQAADVR